MLNIQDNYSLENSSSCKQQQLDNIDVHTPLETTRRDASQLSSNEIYVSHFYFILKLPN